MANENAGLIRAAGIVATGAAVGVLMRLVVWTSPAMRSLMAPLYWFVLAAVIIGVWRVTRRRATQDRRHDDRRHS